MPFELPVQVLDLPGHEPLDLSRWDGRGVPATVLLSWAEDATITPSSVAVLESIDAAELAPADLPRLLKAWDRLEAHAAAQKANGIAPLGHESREVQGWAGQEPTATETVVALRLPLILAQREVHRSKRLHTH